MCGIIFFVLGVLTVTARSAPVENGGCKIIPFEEEIFNGSLLLDNHLMCRTTKDMISTADFCEHLYKCPLDFSEKIRHCEAVCRSDGTWDYTYPSCEDMVPLADAILNAIENQTSGKKGNVNDDEIMLFTKTKDQVRVKRWAKLVRPPTATTSAPPTTTTPAPTLPTSVHLKKLEALCVGHMCPFLKGGKTCKAIEDLTMNDAELQKRICHICVKLFCKASVSLFGSGAK